jgi:hypothetical protein
MVAAANGVPGFAEAKFDTRVQLPVLELKVCRLREPSSSCENNHVVKYPEVPGVFHPVTARDSILAGQLGL